MSKPLPEINFNPMRVGGVSVLPITPNRQILNKVTLLKSAPPESQDAPVIKTTMTITGQDDTPVQEQPVQEVQADQPSQPVQQDQPPPQARANKSTLRLCKKEHQHIPAAEVVSVTTDLLPNEEAELAVIPIQDRPIKNVNSYVIQCSDDKFNLSHYMKPVQQNDKTFTLLVKNDSSDARHLQIMANVLFDKS